MAKSKEETQEYYRKYQKANPEMYWKNNMKYNYKISPEQYYEMLEEQGHVCYLCKNPETMKARGTVRKLCVDHVETARGAVVVRGLLCACCNRAMGLLGDSQRALGKAADYAGRSRFVNGKQKVANVAVS